VSAIAIGIAGLVFGAGQYAYERRRQRRARERALDRQALDIQLTPSGGPVPVALGRFRAEAILAYGTVGSSLPDAAAGDAAAFGALAARRGKHREYLLTQHVVSAGPVGRIVDAQIDGETVRSGKLAPLARVSPGAPGAASAMAAAFTGAPDGTGSLERTSAAKFEGLAYITCAWRRDREDPQFHGVPRPVVFGRGAPARPVVRSGAPGAYVYSLGEPAETSNAATLLLHWLLDAQYGPGLRAEAAGGHWHDEADIDLARAWRAQQLAGEIVLGPDSVLAGGYPAARNAAEATDWATWDEYARALGLEGIGDPGWLDTPGVPAGDDPPIGRCEYNGLLPTDIDFAAQARALRDVMPGLAFWRDARGRYCWDLPDPAVSAADAAVDLVIDDDILLRPVETLSAEAGGRLNAAAGRFASSNLGGEADTAEWPPPGSATAAKLLAEDGGQPLRAEFDLRGTDNAQAAADVLATRVRMSRRPRYRARLAARGWLLEPGDVVAIRSAEQGMDTYVRLRQVTVTPELEVVVEGLEYDPLDYQTTAAEKERSGALDEADDALGRLQAISATITNQMALVRLEPSPDEPAEVSGYQAEVSYDGGSTWSSARALDADAREFRWFAGLDAAADLRFQARPVAPGGRRGAWLRTDSVDLQAFVAAQAWIAGTGPPAAGQGKDGDFYLDRLRASVYQRISGIWVRVASLRSADTSRWLSGSGAPAAAAGQDGDYYFDTASATIYERRSGDWTRLIDIDGADGATWLSGEGDPDASAGKDGDFYLDVSAGRVHKKSAGAWEFVVDITGRSITSITQDPDDPGRATVNYDTGDPDTLLLPANARGVRSILPDTQQDGVAVVTYTDGTQTTLALPRGPAGIGGTLWRFGQGAPDAATGADGDIYLDTDARRVYRKAAGAWGDPLSFAGADAERWLSGAGAPGAADGADGDFYLRSDGTVWRKASGAWTELLDINGPGGATIIAGSGAPDASTGKDGDQYFRTDTGEVYQRAGGAWALLADITGPQGDPGPAGQDGEDGIDGTVWYSVAAGPPAANLGGEGDLAIVTAGGGLGDVYRRGAAEEGKNPWARQANLRGADGDAGGVWLFGSGAPAASLGADGNYYLRTGSGAAAGGIYRKSAGAWSLLLDIDAAGGGSAWLGGAGAPSADDGEDGDYYLRTSDGTVWRKASGAWTELLDITGPAGPTGADGEDGADGTDGTDGEDGDSVAVTAVKSGSETTLTFTRSDLGQIASEVAKILDGADGEDGGDGTDGADGDSVAVTAVKSGSETTLTFTRSELGQIASEVAKILDGADGADGEDGTDGVTTVAATVTLTGDVSGAFTDRGLWSEGIAYAVDDIVSVWDSATEAPSSPGGSPALVLYGGVYRCVEAHTSTSATAADSNAPPFARSTVEARLAKSPWAYVSFSRTVESIL